MIHAENISWDRNEKFTEKQATVFADGTNAYLARFIKRGEEVLVASSDKEKCLIWCDGAICRTDRSALHLREDTEYTPWTGYIQPNGVLYLLPDPESEGRKESTNTEVLVEDEYRQETLPMGWPVIALLTFYGDIPNCGFCYTDELGETHYYAVSMSGFDGSLVVSEF